MIINASEAIENNGVITLSTRVDPGGKYVEIEVADNGSGISEDDLEHIFDPFFTTKDVGHGTGLGLAISYGIVKKHNGTIFVESEVGSGTTFHIRIPIPSPTEEIEGIVQEGVDDGR
jgi:signal transduction histidine kinase